jgi:hypothetical protein
LNNEIFSIMPFYRILNNVHKNGKCMEANWEYGREFI